MKTKTITGYFCDHCKRLYQRKHFAIQHEINCTKNPDNFRPCFGCSHCKKKTVGVFVQGHNSYCTVGTSVLFCEKLGTGLVHPKQQRTGFWYDLEDHENDPMPRNCIHKSVIYEDTLPF